MSCAAQSEAKPSIYEVRRYWRMRTENYTAMYEEARANGLHPALVSQLLAEGRKAASQLRAADDVVKASQEWAGL